MRRGRNNHIIVMISGAQGSGRSTLFNNLLRRPIVVGKSTSEIDIYVIGREDDRNSKQITYIETPGFGITNNEEALYDSIVEYIKEQLDSYIEEESKIRRNPRYEDTRVQCLLYTIPATGNGLKPRDIAFLIKVSSLVNIIPVITKSDALSINELQNLKELLLEQFKQYNIDVFQGYSENEDAGDSIFKNTMPFAVICADECIDTGRYREHIAGPIEIESGESSDLQVLRNVLLKTHTDLLIDTTAIDIYEKYRSEVLESVINQ